MTQPLPDQGAHGRFTVIKIGTVDISAMCKTSSLEQNPDIHDITGYGKNAKVKQGGLLDHTLTLGGWYSKDETYGPGVVFDGHVGETVPVERQLLGTGPGLPKQSMNAVIGKYVETAPVDDVVQWTCDLAVSDDITRTDQTVELLDAGTEQAGTEQVGAERSTEQAGGRGTARRPLGTLVDA
jgi:hypothetical protein